MIEVRLAQQGMGMQDGTIVRWLKSESERVEKDELLAEVETAKAVVEVTAPVAGVLHRILVKVNENVPVQTPLALIDDGRGNPSIGSDPQPATSPGVQAARLQTTAAVQVQKRGAQVEPRALRAAKELGVDIASVTGSGPNGRVTEADVRASVSAMRTMATQLSGMRKMIGARLQQSKRDAPHFRVHMDVEVDRFLQQLERLNADHPGIRITMNDLLIKASALALLQEPQLNVQFDGQTVQASANANISVAMAVKDGLIAPVVREADRKTVVEIAEEMRDFALRAKAKAIKSEELEGGTFSLSNLGMFGVKQFDAIINPPQVAILAIGAAEPRAIIKNGAVCPATVMTLCLSSDHRVIDGAIAARFLATLRTHISSPTSLA
ncbi:MAG: 2-oxo acid dehydrogenase subunit E2 [Bryobacterales bacterium]|nr:2-oxo acid dehydrogenase subunit E2 [Bryobacterales bacterium]